MSTRRQFFGTLGRALLLPMAGTGAVAFAEPSKAAALSIKDAALPFSAECLELRQIKRALAALPRNSNSGMDGPWYQMRVNEYGPVRDRLVARQAPSWTACVELAELIWSDWRKQSRDGWCRGPDIPVLSVDRRDWGGSGVHDRDAIAALVEGVLTLGKGERFDPCLEQGRQYD
jgi:hypothetical protein